MAKLIVKSAAAQAAQVYRAASGAQPFWSEPGE